MKHQKPEGLNKNNHSKTLQPLKYEIICIHCLGSPNKNHYKKYRKILPAFGTEDFRKAIHTFKEQHNHAVCIVRTKRKDKYQKDKSLRKEFLTKRKEKTHVS